MVASTLAWMCRERDIEFDVYYASDREGGLFSSHGSALLGGRHYAAIARALAQFETTVIRLGDVHVFDSLIRSGASRVIEAPESVVDLYEQCAKEIGLEFPHNVVAFQTEGLPENLGYGLVQYAFPEVVERRALAVPLELTDAEILKLKELGIKCIWTVATQDASMEGWRRVGFALEVADVLRREDDYSSLTFRMAKRWIDRAYGVDLCEPVLASYWLPFSICEGRLQVCAEGMDDTIAQLLPLVREKGQKVVYGRYGGGVIGGARDDEDLFELFENDVAFEVVEPCRPVLTVFSRHPVSFPQPSKGPFELEPPDGQLRMWAEEGRIPVSLLFHSGELSHDDAIVNIMDLCALTKVKVGISVHMQRYTFDPDSVEPMHVPVEEGGVLGLCEPVLHSSGFGIIAEGLASEEEVVRMMREAKGCIAKLAGERFAPRGVYCYLDAVPGRWDEDRRGLWKAIACAGFDYVISSVARDGDRLLYREGDFVVMGQCGRRTFPYSPFTRVEEVEQMVELERKLASSGKPGWMIAVLDGPIYAYPAYLSRGDPFKGVRLGQFFDYIEKGGETGKLISATPHTIARFVRILSKNFGGTG